MGDGTLELVEATWALKDTAQACPEATWALENTAQAYSGAGWALENIAQAFSGATWALQNIAQPSQALLGRSKALHKETFERTIQENCLGFDVTLHHSTLATSLLEWIFWGSHML